MCAQCAIPLPQGQPLEFKVIKLDQKRNNVVVSRRAVIGESRTQRWSLTYGRRGRQGAIQNLRYGAFVDRRHDYC